MNVALAIAGLCWFALALGHTMIGVRWVLPGIAGTRLRSAPMVRFTWHILGLLLAGFGVLFMALAFAPDADPRTLLLRWVAALLVGATVMACWQARRRPRSLLRPPVALVFVLIAVLSWTASA